MLLLKGYTIKALESSAIALALGGVFSYIACSFFEPASTMACATVGAIAALWASFATYYFHAAK